MKKMKKDGQEKGKTKSRVHARAPQPLVGLCGKLRTGKTTAANFLVAERGYKEVAFARKLKAIVAILFDWPLDVLMASTPELRTQREQLPERTLCGKTYNARTALEFVGTDLFRQHMGESIWVEAAMAEIDAHHTNNDPVVVSDVRFTNEIEALRNHGAELVLLHRQPDDLRAVEGEHRSNNEFLERREYMSTLANTGTLTEFKTNLDRILIASPPP